MALAVGLALPSHTAAAPVYGTIEISNVVRVYDGDTFFVNVDSWPDVIGRKIGIRVNGIDTPEIRGKCALHDGWSPQRCLPVIK